MNIVDLGLSNIEIQNKYHTVFLKRQIQKLRDSNLIDGENEDENEEGDLPISIDGIERSIDLLNSNLKTSNNFIILRRTPGQVNIRLISTILAGSLSQGITAVQQTENSFEIFKDNLKLVVKDIEVYSIQDLKDIVKTQKIYEPAYNIFVEKVFNPANRFEIPTVSPLTRTSAANFKDSLIKKFTNIRELNDELEDLYQIIKNRQSEVGS
tara:strand:+ start:3369 stop:3998 length:630 start_codon:yes stop_codon:yes gene_type:complete